MRRLGTGAILATFVDVALRTWGGAKPRQTVLKHRCCLVSWFVNTQILVSCILWPTAADKQEVSKYTNGWLANAKMRWCISQFVLPFKDSARSHSHTHEQKPAPGMFHACSTPMTHSAPLVHRVATDAIGHRCQQRNREMKTEDNNRSRRVPKMWLGARCLVVGDSFCHPPGLLSGRPDC